MNGCKSDTGAAHIFIFGVWYTDIVYNFCVRTIFQKHVKFRWYLVENVFRDLKFVIFGWIRQNTEPFNIGIICPDLKIYIFSETYIVHIDTSKIWSLDMLYHGNFEVFTITSKIRTFVKKTKNLNYNWIYYSNTMHHHTKTLCCSVYMIFVEVWDILESLLLHQLQHSDFLTHISKFSLHNDQNQWKNEKNHKILKNVRKVPEIEYV